MVEQSVLTSRFLVIASQSWVLPAFSTSRKFVVSGSHWMRSQQQHSPMRLRISRWLASSYCNAVLAGSPKVTIVKRQLKKRSVISTSPIKFNIDEMYLAHLRFFENALYKLTLLTYLLCYWRKIVTCHFLYHSNDI